MRIQREADYKISLWDGGYTKELFLYPENGSYQERNFQIRISTAKIEKEVSKFTLLPGVERYLMMQEGDVRLVFGDGEEKNLCPRQIIRFMGDEEITSYGTGMDMNLMLKDGAKGEMQFAQVPEGEMITLPGNTAVILYVMQGEGTIDGQKIAMGETVILKNQQVQPPVINTGISQLACCIFLVTI